jgi:hypothetical protein
MAMMGGERMHVFGDLAITGKPRHQSFAKAHGYIRPDVGIEDQVEHFVQEPLCRRVGLQADHPATFIAGNAARFGGGIAERVTLG